MVAKRLTKNASIPERWMVCRVPSDRDTYKDSLPNPKKLYTREVEARRDAEQMARDQGREYFLLKVIDRCGPTTPPVVWASET